LKAKFRLYPEVAGQLGEETVMDISVHPPIVSVLHHEFDGWLGDDLLEVFPCYICSEKLKNIIQGFDFSGYKLEHCKISKTGIFLDMYPHRELPNFYWLKIEGKENDDFFVDEEGLIVSEDVLKFLKKANLNYCRILPEK
jgi:hypothetical protein